MLVNHNKSQFRHKLSVMLIEIPDPEVILGVILAFLVGLVGLYGFYKLKPLIKSNKMK